MAYPSLILKPNRSASVLRQHPWVFSGAIAKIILPEGAHEPHEGDLVQVCDHKENLLAYGHFGEGSIAVRILSFDDSSLNANFWNLRIEQAKKLRQQAAGIRQESTNCYRLVHAEGDGLPGLIIDVYGEVAVVQAHSLGMGKNLDKISQAIQLAFQGQLKSIYSKSQATLPKMYAADFEDGYLWKEEGFHEDKQQVKEHGLQFEIDWVKGQKTGFFLDQRENRLLLQSYAKGKRVLNTFCYSGGFSVYALKGGAKEVHSVDSSAKAIELCENNVKLNFPESAPHKSTVADTLQFLKSTKECYDLIVLDPPAYAKSKSASHNAIQGYRRLNERALSMIEPGGILFTFSCSQVIHRKLFEDTVTAAAIDAGRIVKILAHLSQPEDHPVSIFHPEGAYLKGLVLYIES